MEIARITPICKGQANTCSAVFFKILERIMYNRLYLYLTESNLFYDKQFGFQKDIPLIMLFFNSQIKYTKCLIKTFTHQAFLQIGLFFFFFSKKIDRSKAFDTVNPKILLRKLSHCGIKNKSLDWFTCYLSNRKQFIGYNVNSKSTLLDIVCGVPQRSILGPPCYSCFI